MALEVVVYTDPGIYITEVIPPGAANAAVQPNVLGIVAPGNRLKQVTNEAIVRGGIDAEALTFTNLTGLGNGTSDNVTAPSGGRQTLTLASLSVLPLAIGTEITLRKFTNAVNNGKFIILDRLSATSVVYANPAGVLESPIPATATWAIKPYAVVGGVSTPVRTNRALQNTTLKRNGKTIGDSFIRFRPAHIEAATSATVAIIHPTSFFANGAVRVAATATISASYTYAEPTLTAVTAGAAGNTINGVTLTVGQRLLVTSYAGAGANAANGVYRLLTAGSDTGPVAAVFTRDTDADVTGEYVQNRGVFVEEGTVAAKSTYVYTTASSPTLGTTALAFAVANDAIGVLLDGHVPLTIILTAEAGATTVIGTEVTIGASKIASLVAVSRAEFAAAILEGLNPADSLANTAVTALGYGATYATAATVITDYGLRIGLPLATPSPSSDVQLLDPYTRSGLNDIFGAAGALNRLSPSVLELERVAYTSTATYTLSYVSTTATTDPLLQDDVQTVIRVGTAQGTSTFTESRDFALGTDVLDWSLATAATLTSLAGPFDLSTTNRVKLGVDGKTPVEIQLTGMSSPPIGYSNAQTAATAQAFEVANNINAVLADSADYGLAYKSVASVLTVSGLSYVVLTSVLKGTSGEITLAATSSSTTDATMALFGLASTQLPYTTIGAGNYPATASQYFATYQITRPTADYNVQKRYVSETAAANDLGEVNSLNPLMVGVHVAFAQLVASVVVVQVNDATTAGSPTRAEFSAGMTATTRSDLITESVVLSTELVVQIDHKNLIESEASPLRKHYRRGYFGMANGTVPGSKDTLGSYIYMASQVLQFTSESAGRGRAILVASPQPDGTSIDVQVSDGSIERIELDGSYLALGVAAIQAAFTGPAMTLANATIKGLNIDDIDLNAIWQPEERHLMADAGVMVTTFDASSFKILDPVTTEGALGSARMPRFLYPASTAQKDNVTRAVTANMAVRVVGIVPTDDNDFILEVRLALGDELMAQVAATNIAPFRNDDGTKRRVNITTDIDVTIDANNPDRFYFEYNYNLRYAKLRGFGIFSVDRPT